MPAHDQRTRSDLVAARRLERPANRCLLKKFASPSTFHQRFGYASSYSENPVARDIATSHLADGSRLWSAFMTAIDGQSDRLLLDRVVRRYLTDLGRLETIAAEAVPGLSFETYSQLRTAFVAARLQADAVMDDVYDGDAVIRAVHYGGATSGTTGAAPAPQRAIGRGGAGAHSREIYDRSIAGPEAPAVQPWPETVALSAYPEPAAPDRRPLSEAAAWRGGLVVGALAGAAYILHALAR